jgi:hypothetical protein
MKNRGPYVSHDGLDRKGFITRGTVFWNLPGPQLYEHAIRRGETFLAQHGSLVTATDEHTGWAPNDNLVVREATTEGDIWWGYVNRPFEQTSFNRILEMLRGCVQDRDIYVLDGYAGFSSAQALHAAQTSATDSSPYIGRLASGTAEDRIGQGPGAHPDPSDLSALSLPLVTLEQPWFRVHRRIHDPLHFGKSGDSRFDAPAKEYGALYLAADLRGAFVETFIRGKKGRHFITQEQLRPRLLAELRFPQGLRLVDLTGTGLARIGADGRLCAGGNYRLSQRWALALWQHPERPDGILYPSRHDLSQRCAVVFDRAGVGVSAVNLGSFLDQRHRALLGELLETYQFSLLS